MKKTNVKLRSRLLGAGLAVALTAAAAMGLAGCSASGSSASGSAAAKSDTMNVAWTSNAGDYNIDPTNNYMGWQGSYLGIYEQIYRIDGNFEPQPMLAQSAEMVNDTTWKITLRDNVTFQNGNKMDAAAVKASLERAISMNDRAKKSLDIASITAEGNVLTIVTNGTNYGFVNELCEPVTSIIDVNSGFKT